MKFEIEVPDQIVEFLKEFNINPEGYAKECVLQGFCADVDAFYNDPKVFIDLEGLIKKYNLKKIIHTYNK